MPAMARIVDLYYWTIIVAPLLGFRPIVSREMLF